MRTEKEIVESIIELEVRNDMENDGYLDEGEQAELNTLYWVLERNLTQNEEKRIEELREQFINENCSSEDDEDEWY